jgi:hypothetical protein
MPYDIANPPHLTAQAVGSTKGGSTWNYASADPLATVIAVDYIANGDLLGMEPGDVVYVQETLVPPVVSVAYVTTVTPGGPASLVDAMTVAPPPLVPPVVTLDPVATAVVNPATATFTSVATGSVSVQWYKDTVLIVGATAADYTTPPTVIGDNGAVFHATYTNVDGDTDTAGAVLTVT